MPAFFVVGIVALGASLLTFFSGFGLGTLLLPAMTLFFPIGAAVAATGVVHMANNLVKGVLLIPKASWPVVLKFGVPAMAASWLGAKALILLSGLPSLLVWHAAGHDFAVTPVKAIVGAVLAAFAVLEIVPVLANLQFAPAWLPIGGILSGFFGGLSGFQGAFRSAVLVKAGLSKEAYLATGVAIALAVDFVRLSTYALAFTGGPMIAVFAKPEQVNLLLVGIAAAFAGTLAGNRLLSKVTLPGIQRLVTAMLLVFAGLLAAGIV